MRIFLTAVFAYVALTFVLGFVWNLVLFSELYEGLTRASRRPDPIIPLGLLAIFFEAVTLSLAFLHFHAPKNGLRSALSISLGLGVFSMTYASFVVPAKFMIEPFQIYTLMELGFGLIHYVLAGFVLAFVFRTNRTDN